MLLETIRRLDPFLRSNALLVVVLGYLVMPYPPRPGLFTLSALIAFLFLVYILVTRPQAQLDTAPLLLLTAFAAYDFLFLFREGFSFPLLRAYSFGLMTFLATAVYTTREGLRRLSVGLALWLGATVVVCGAQFIGGDAFYLPLYFQYFGGAKASGLFNFRLITTPVGLNFAKTQLGGQLAFIVPFLLYVAAARPRRGRGTWAGVAVSAMILALSFSRAAWAGVFGALLVAMMFRYPGYLKAVGVFAVVFGLTLAAVALDPREHYCVEKNCATSIYKNKAIVAQAVHASSDVSARTRVVLVAAGLRTAAENPFGGGPGFFTAEYDQHKANVLSGVDSRPNLAPHNTYVQVLAEKGVPGLALFALLLGTILFKLFRQARTRADCYPPAVLAGLAGILIYGLFHEALPDRMIWIALGMAVASYQRASLGTGIE